MSMRSTGARLQIVRDELPARTAAPTVGLLLADRRLARAVGRAVRASSANALVAVDVAAVTRAIESHQLDVLIVDMALARRDSAGLDALLALPNPPPLIVLDDGLLDEHLELVGPHCHNVVAKVVANAGHVTGPLLTTLRKLLDRDIFGAEKYVSWGATVHTLRVHASAQRDEAQSVLSTFLEEIDCNPRYRQQLAVVADELLMNALVHGPRTAAGDRRHGEAAAHADIVLAPHEAISLEFTTDGRSVAIACRDPFGSLAPDDVLTTIRTTSRSCRGVHGIPDRGPAEAGLKLGLYIAYRAADQLIVNVEPGVMTELIGVLDVSAPYRAHRRQPKSIHLFAARPLEEPGPRAAAHGHAGARPFTDLELAALREASAVKQELMSARRRVALAADELRRKDELLAMLGHDLRGPLTPMRYGIELMRSPDTAPVADRLERQLAHLERLVEDVVELSRVTLDVETLARRPTDLAALVRQAIDVSGIDPPGAGPHERARHIIALDQPPHPVMANVDAVRMQQVLINLLHNAAKFTPSGGHIDVRLVEQPDAIVLEVADDGAGIPQSMLERIFEPFTRLDRPPDGAKGGLGLGLSIVRKLVELHGGTVTAASAGPGTGSTFRVTLPRDARAGTPAAR